MRVLFASTLRCYRTRVGVSPTNVHVFAQQFSRFVTDFGPLANRVAAAGHRVRVHSPRSDHTASPWSRPEVKAGHRRTLHRDIEVDDLPWDRESLRARDALRAMIDIYKLGRRDPDAVSILWALVPMVIGGLPLRAQRRRCVFLLTGMGTFFGHSRRPDILVIRAALTVIYRYLFTGENSRVIVHNHDDARWLFDHGVPEENVMVTFGCGVDPAQFPYSETLPRRKPPIILAPARLTREKGVADAVAASAILRRRGVDHEMWFTHGLQRGNPMHLGADDVARWQGDNPCVKFTGFHRDLVPLYHQCDIVCVPTWYHEGLPTTLLEAAACGRPAVTCDTWGCREIVRDGDTGLLVPPRSPEQLADALKRLIVDAELAKAIQRRAYAQFLARGTKQHMVERSLAILRSLDVPVVAATPAPA